MLKALLSKEDVIVKVLYPTRSTASEYRSFRDGSRFNKNAFLAEKEFGLALGSYIDDFEVANPLGTSKKKQKLCAVYWVLANLDSEYHSSLHAI